MDLMDQMDLVLHTREGVRNVAARFRPRTPVPGICPRTSRRPPGRRIVGCLNRYDCPQTWPSPNILLSVTNPLAILIAEDLLTIGQAVDIYLNGLDEKKPAPGSPAQLERQSKYGQAQGGDAFNLVEMELWMTMGIPSDHLQAAHRLMVQGDDVGIQRYAVLSVLRVALEVSSLAWWLADPRITARERVTRALRLAEHSRQRRGKVEKHIVGSAGDPSSLQPAQRLIEGLARELRIQDLTSRMDDGGEVRIPDAVDLVRNQFEGFPSADPESAVAIYGMLSEPMHGNFFASSGGYRRPTSEDTVQELQPAVPLFDIAIGANYATSALAYACKAFIGWMGWDVNEWDDLAHDSVVRIQEAVEITRQM